MNVDIYIVYFQLFDEVYFGVPFGCFISSANINKTCTYCQYQPKSELNYWKQHRTNLVAATQRELLLN